MAITITLNNTVGKINTPVHVPVTITSTNKIQGTEWRCNKDVNYSVSLDQRTLNFTPSVDGVYIFTVYVVDSEGDSASKTVSVTVGIASSPPQQPPTQEPSPVPTPQPEPQGGVIYDSNIHGKWNNGVKRVITDSEGNIGANGKGLYMAASGDPKLQIDGDGIAHLISGSGGVENLSVKVRSRHGEGGDAENRFGGIGCHVSRSEIGMKIEKFHNEHESGTEKALGVDVDNGKWHKLKYQVKGDTSKIDQIAWVDGIQKLTGTKSSPPEYYTNKALYDKQSYLWIRINNSDHGRIYICATNYNSVLEFEFMFEPSKNSVALRNVKLIAL